MGDPKKQRKKYSTPSHPWRKSRIDSERIILTDYGLKNHKEIWKFSSRLKRFTTQAKKLIAATSEQAKKEELQLKDKLFKLGIIHNKTIKPEDILNLTIQDVLNRRLQTLVYKQGLAKSVNQARQFIIHGHIFVNGNKVTIPSYMVTKDEEHKIIFNPSSKISSLEHPERINKTETHKEIKNEKS